MSCDISGHGSPKTYRGGHLGSPVGIRSRAYTARALRTSRALRTVAAGAVAVGVAAPLVRHRLRLKPAFVSALAWQAPVALALARPRSGLRDAGIYAIQMWAYIAHYEMPNDDPERLLERLHVRYPIKADTVLGGGTTPTVRLQRRLGRPGQVRRHDLVLAWVHWSWFIVPHGTSAYILLRHRWHFPRAAYMMAAVFDVGLLGYWLLPTAPPWWAGKTGQMPPVRRIMVEAGEHFWGRLWRPLYDFLGGNPFAAMPSLHFATSVMAAHVLTEVGRVEGILGWTYAGSLGFALVYLGEHYVVDLIAGLALAEGVRALAPAGARALAPAARAIQRLEPGAA
jgi:membrane-associated phospholipid phosphatase